MATVHYRVNAGGALERAEEGRAKSEILCPGAADLRFARDGRGFRMDWSILLPGNGLPGARLPRMGVAAPLAEEQTP